MTAETTRLSIFGMKHHYKLKILINIFLLGLLPFVFLTCSPMIEDFNSLVKENGSDNIQFTVEYYADGVASSEIDYENPIKTATSVSSGIPGEYEADSIPGFTYQSRSTAQNASGNLILTLIYSRNLVALNFDISGSPNGAEWTNGSTDPTLYSISKKFGTPTASFIPDENDMSFSPTYNFLGWTLTKNGEFTDPQVVPTFPATETTYYAKWISATAPYSVKYYFEDVSTSEYVENTTLSYTVESALTGSSINYIEPNSQYTQFYNEPIFSGDTVVKSDGTSVLCVYYEKSSVTLTFDANGGLWTDDGSSENRELTGKIGASLSAADIEKISVEKTDYDFVGWNNGTVTVSAPSEYPESSVSYTARWSQNASDYTVYYFYEKTGLGTNNHYAETTTLVRSNFEKDESKTVSAKAEIGSEINVSIPTVSGFTAIDPGSFEITDDEESNVINVFYYRNAITLTYKSDSDDAVTNGAQNGEYGKFTSENGGGTSRTVSGFYGDAVETTYSGTDVEKETSSKKWVFSSWSTTPATSTFPATDEVYIALWTQTQAIYTVKYYFEMVDGENSVWTEDMEKKYTAFGVVGETTTVSAAAQDSVEGYYAPTVTNVTIVAEATSVVRVEYKSKASTSSGMINPGTTDITLTVEVTGTTITASCTRSGTNITSCTWYLNGVEQSGTSSLFTKNDVSAGTYTLFVVARDGYAEYTASATVTVQ